MKIRAISLLMLLFLPGCDASREIERGMALRSTLLRSEVSFDAGITADYGTQSHTFRMHCQFDETGDLTFEVTQPEDIAGITGNIREEGGELTFDDTLLQFELLTDDQLSPISAPWILMKTLRSGYLTAAGEEGELLRLTIDDSYEEDALKLDVWLNGENQPVSADILYDGLRILSVQVENFVVS